MPVGFDPHRELARIQELKERLAQQRQESKGLNGYVEQKVYELLGSKSPKARAYRSHGRDQESQAARQRILAYRQEQFSRGLKQCCKGFGA
jgi:hypothetical protein